MVDRPTRRTRQGTRGLLGVLAAAALISGGARARACGACGCGDPTLTAVGFEQPYKNRLRVSLEERFGTDSNGGGDALVRRQVSRTQLGLSYTPHLRITLAAFLPFVVTGLRGPTIASARVAGLGDLELQARVLLARDRAFAPRHLFWLVAGVKAPTGPRIRDDAGFPYPDDDQPGSGSWDPLAGVTYAWVGGIVSVYGALSFRYPTAGPRGDRFGQKILSSAAVQLQPWSWLALQLGADLRQAWSDRLANGAVAPNTGGFVAGLVPGVLIKPWRDLLLRAAAEVPIAQALTGTQSIGPQLIVSISNDFL